MDVAVVGTATRVAARRAVGGGAGGGVGEGIAPGIRGGVGAVPSAAFCPEPADGSRFDASPESSPDPPATSATKRASAAWWTSARL